MESLYVMAEKGETARDMERKKKGVQRSFMIKFLIYVIGWLISFV